jgi:hypothetical protein
MERQGRGSSFSVEPASSSTANSVQNVRAGLLKQTMTNRPARFPPTGVWPFELRADMVAALLDFETTRQLCKAIADGTAPRPGAIRGRGVELEVVWSREAIRVFVAARHRAMQPDLDERGREIG